MIANKKLPHVFLLTMLIVLLAVALWIFRPFLLEILLSGVIASFFYPMYKWLAKRLGHNKIASLITTLFIALIVIVPITNFFIYVINRAIEGYSSVAPYLTSDFLNSLNINKYLNSKIFSIGNFNLSDYVTTIVGGLNIFLVTLSKTILIGTRDFLISFVVILLTIFFLFIEGKNIARKVMNLTPLPNRYDQLLFKTFREVSYSTILSSFAVAIFQGVLGGVGFWIAGFPGLFAGLLISLASFVPYVGSFLIWGPTALYLLFVGNFFGAIILVIFGLVISTGDNVIRTFLIKGKSQVHELIVFFSIVGGIFAFGFWGVIIGPLLISLLFTVISIYELEFGEELEKEREE
jgi:predicted PurR-regulated permease PerM